MITSLRFAIVAGIALALAFPAAGKPPLEAFGDVPEVRAMELAPDGKKAAYILNRKGVDQLMLLDLETKKVEALATVTDFKARGVTFVTPKHVILHASVTTRNIEYGTRKFEHTGAFAVNLETRKAVQLLRRADLFPVQSGLGDIVGVDPGGRHVYMPAFAGTLSEPKLNVLRVSLDNGDGAAGGGRTGTANTRDWIYNAAGETIAREDYSEKTKEYAIYAYSGDTSRVVLARKGEHMPYNLVGLTPDEKSLVITDMNSDFYSLYEVSLTDGAIRGPILKRDDADMVGAIRDRGNVVRGVIYGGLFPSYELFDAAVEADVKAVQGQLPASAVTLSSWSDDWSRLLLMVSGGGLSERYVLFDRTARKMEIIALSRPAIRAEDVGAVTTIEYRASDDLRIPALVTWPTGVAEADRKNLPMIVLPHGGPEAYDTVGFDWMAQYFANEGYMVLQPNFRGSGGFGESFAAAGRRQWGRKMQDDITDGAKAMARMGWADPNRVCILGGSYGGYAALAGGALTPDLYKCVVAIAGVSDLREMLVQERRENGPDSLAFAYWTRHIGDLDTDLAAINAVSPVNHAASFKAPVLLIHGTDDTVVLSKQSDLMEAALKAAGKNVTYIRLKGDDHNLSRGENRRAALEAMGKFVAQHIGAGR